MFELENMEILETEILKAIRRSHHISPIRARRFYPWDWILFINLDSVVRSCSYHCLNLVLSGHVVSLRLDQEMGLWSDPGTPIITHP